MMSSRTLALVLPLTLTACMLADSYDFDGYQLTPSAGAGQAGAGGSSGGGGMSGSSGQGGVGNWGGTGAAGCVNPLRVYEDKDGDGFGSKVNKNACAFEDGWVFLPGDCHDGNKDVYPGQSSFFAQPYLDPTGQASFDYNCDGEEQAEGELEALNKCNPGACNQGKEGYEENGEPLGVSNRLCGSTVKVKCEGSGAACGATKSEGPAVGCR